MSFRTDPLPSYEDIISGKFCSPSPVLLNENSIPSLKRSETNRSDNTNNQKTTNKNHSGTAKNGDFKYINVNKISSQEEVEDGEISEESTTLSNKTKSNSHQRNNNNNNNNSNNKKVKMSSVPEKKLASENARNKDFKSNLVGGKKTSSTSSNTPFVPRLICRYFMEGICTKSDKCTFSHASVPNKTAEEARVKEPCKFLIAGSCMKGDACYFSHDLSIVPCKFFHLKGECSSVVRGKSCRFSHAPLDAEALLKLRNSEEERIKEKRQAENGNSPQSPKTNPGQAEAGKETCEETETTTTSPHDEISDINLFNPFAGGDNEFD